MNGCTPKSIMGVNIGSTDKQGLHRCRRISINRISKRPVIIESHHVDFSPMLYQGFDYHWRNYWPLGCQQQHRITWGIGSLLPLKWLTQDIQEGVIL